MRPGLAAKGIRVTDAQIEALALCLRRTAIRDTEEFCSLYTRFPSAPPVALIDNRLFRLDEPFARVKGQPCLVDGRYSPRHGGRFGRRSAKTSHQQRKALGLAMWVFSLGVAFDSDDERWAAAHRFAAIIVDPSAAVCRRASAPFSLPREPYRRLPAATAPTLDDNVTLVSAVDQLHSGAAA
jgi:hypothetical protein